MIMTKKASLPPELLAVIQHKGTEKPFSGFYNDFQDEGSYLCRQCGLALFRSHTKFHSGCGWPSFDQEIPNAILRERDADGIRCEILCARCHAHLGHVFKGEQLTALNTRHCVNSTSLDFIPDLNVVDTEEAIFAAGCFWGVQSLFNQLKGVLKTEVGYTGGKKNYPTYNEVCSGTTGHFEAIRVIYDPKILSYEQVVKYFFEIHDPTQQNGQGPDRGDQYRSAIFYYDDNQRKIAEKMKILLANITQTSIATLILPVSLFWPAEDYHQNYDEKTGHQPYCHHHVKKF